MISDFLSTAGTEEIFNKQSLKLALIALFIFILFIILNSICSRYISVWLQQKFSGRTSSEARQKQIKAILRPVKGLILGTGIYAVLQYLPLSPSVDDILLKIYRSILIVLVTWGACAITNPHSFLAEEAREKLKMDGTLLPLISKITRFIIIALGILIIAEEWDYHVDGFIAGLGLGGLAIALAAKDMLSNMFGGIVIILEKPFSIGDWIATPSVEGVVEGISFRSTRIRAFTQSEITVPNSTLAGEPITNYSRMGKRRITFRLGLTYDSPRNQLQECIKQIRQMLTEHPAIHPETVHVYLEQFGESSLELFLYYFTSTTEWGEFMAVKQDTLLKMMEIIESLGLSMAFPSRSIYLQNTRAVKD